MFQSFKTSADREAGPSRLKHLQREMKAEGITHFLVPHADEHQNEYLPQRAERLAWLTGFTGSAGFAIASLSGCVVFVDGRYTLQAGEQIHPDSFSSASLLEMPPSKWLQENTKSDDRIAYDPWLIADGQLETYETAAKKNGASLMPIENLIDRIWTDQPEAPMEPVNIHPIKFAGKSAEDKIVEIQKLIGEAAADITILTDPASLAWMFNIRGSDVAHNPLALGFALVPNSGRPQLFMDERKFNRETRSYVDALADLLAPDHLETELARHAAGKTVMYDPASVPVALTTCINAADGKTIKGRDPVILPRAIKNETEISGSRTAHIRDGVAMCKFLCWLDQQEASGLDEISTATKLEEIRSANAKAMNSELKEISFDTISGHGPNGAIVHYRVNNQSNRKFTDNSVYLVDSGGQYLDGTTDITRSIAIGTPPTAAIVDFTLVLKGHIAVATARFPKGTRGVDIDGLARSALWQRGKNFAHGTGHGVGSYLNVHEGPQSISSRAMEPLVAGMIISNEPGLLC